MKSDAKERPDGYDALPKRFKDYIRQLEDEIHGLKASQPVKERTRIHVVDHMAAHEGRAPYYLPDKTRFAYHLRSNAKERGGGESMVVSLAERVRGEKVLEIHAEWNGIAVYPHSGNVVHIGFGRGE